MTTPREDRAGPPDRATLAFNRACGLAALALLLASAVQSLASRAVTYDFCQYYMAGLIARHGHWDALYPVPNPGADEHPGYPRSSTMRPEYEALLRAAGVDDNARFIQPPPVALLMLPFAALDYRIANGAWVLLNTACLWLVAWQAARGLRLLDGRPSRAEGLLILFIACSPLYRQAMRIGNVSPVVGLCLGAGVLGLITRDRIRAPLGLVLGAFGKYVTLLLVPLYAMTRRWGTLAVAGALFALLILATLAIAGAGPFVTFAREMVPTFGRPDDQLPSITAHSFLAHMAGGGPIPRWAERAVRAVELALIAVGAAGLIRSRRTLAGDPAMLLAASLAMVGGLLIFSPLAWGHYVVYLVPFWGYLAWEARRSRWMRWPIVAALLLLWAPRQAIRSIDTFREIRLPAIAESSELWAMIVVVGVALARLHRPGSGTTTRPGSAGGPSVALRASRDAR